MQILLVNYMHLNCCSMKIINNGRKKTKFSLLSVESVEGEARPSETVLAAAGER